MPIPRFLFRNLNRNLQFFRAINFEGHAIAQAGDLDTLFSWKPFTHRLQKPLRHVDWMASGISAKERNEKILSTIADCSEEDTIHLHIYRERERDTYTTRKRLVASSKTNPSKKEEKKDTKIDPRCC